MTEKFSGEYPIENREGEIERLFIQGDAMAPETEEMLSQIGVGAGWRCLDLGCGPRGITPLLSAAVGATGRVLGLDMNEKFLAFARASAAANVTFEQGDAYATGLPDESFDFVHMRFLGCTAGQPKALIDEAVRLVRPGGVVALQEPDAQTLNAYPPHAAFTRLKALLSSVFRTTGAGSAIAHQCYSLVRQAGLEEVAYRPFLLGVRSSDPLVDFLPSTVESIRSELLRLELTTQTALEADLSACRAHLSEPDTVFTMFTVVQVWGRKSGGGEGQDGER